ncbi:MAG: 16S rRNA (cytidine(1402)-2'-O)-methyltransferase [Patescibacteria group bacterium]
MQNNSGTLFIVSTPIGNLGDITLRAIKTLFEVDFIACEDTRVTGKLLKSIKPIYENLYAKTAPQHRLISYYEENEEQRIPQIINSLKSGLNIALISDAGTPSVSDPGFEIVRECIRENLKVVSIPGPSASLAALTMSGLPTDKFVFVGYPPRKHGNRIKFFEKLKFLRTEFKATIIMYEAPHRIIQLLSEMGEIFGDIEIVLERELTKVFEETIRGKISELKKHFDKKPPKGEFVILFN